MDFKRQTKHVDDAGLLITVAICTRNRCQGLLQAVESVLPQLTAKTELLIIDNGSIDETQREAQRLRQRDPRVRYELARRPGIACARNAALSRAHGIYVLFLDDDEKA